MVTGCTAGAGAAGQQALDVDTDECFVSAAAAPSQRQSHTQWDQSCKWPWPQSTPQGARQGSAGNISAAVPGAPRWDGWGASMGRTGSQVLTPL